MIPDPNNLWQTLRFPEVPDAFSMSEEDTAAPILAVGSEDTTRMLRAALRRPMALREVADEFFAAVMDRAEEVQVPPGTRLVDFGNEEPAVWIVLSGEARASRRLRDPRIPELHAHAYGDTPLAKVVGRFRSGSWIGLPTLAWQLMQRTIGRDTAEIQAEMESCESDLLRLQADRERLFRSEDRRRKTDEIEAAHTAVNILQVQRALQRQPSSDFAVEVLPPEPGAPTIFRALRLSIEDGLALAEQFPAFSTFMAHHVTNSSLTVAALHELVEKNPLLRSLDAGQRQLFFQLSMRRRYQRKPSADEKDLPYLSARKAHGRVALIIEGAGQVYLPATKAHPGRLAADVAPGELVGHEHLVTPKDLTALDRLRDGPSVRVDELQIDRDARERRRDSDVFLADGTELLEIDWLTLRWILASRTTSWLPALHWFRAGCAEVAPQPARVIAVLGSGRGLGTTSLGYALLATLTRIVDPPDHAGAKDGESRPPIFRDIVLVDVQGERSFNRTWGPAGYTTRTRTFQRPPELCEEGEDHEVRIKVLARTGPDSPDPLNLDKVAVVWPDDPRVAADLIAHLRTVSPASRVLVAGMERGDPLFDYLCEVIPGTGVTICWVHDDPYEPYTLGDALPETLIRVDRVNGPYRRKALAKAAAAPEDWATPGTGGMDMPPYANGVVRVLDDPEHAALLERGEVDAFLNATHASPLARASWRLGRAVAGRSVGLALGGGGIWGTAHIALIRELELSDMPIDYVAGTSFGSVVGGLYAAGGYDALVRLLEENCAPPGRGGTARGLIWSLRKSPLFQSIANSFYSTEQMGHELDALIARTTDIPLVPLECTEVPFLPISTNLDAAAPFATLHGTVGYGIRASSGLPPSLPGMWWRGQRILDGAMVANVPAEMVRAYGAHYVISANVVAPTDPEPETDRSRRAQLYDATIRRFTDTIRGVYLLSWKAGDDQGRLRADYRVDLWTEGAELFEWWKGWQIVNGTQSGLFKMHTAVGIRKHWSARNRGESPPYSRVRTRVEVEL